MNKVLNSIH